MVGLYENGSFILLRLVPPRVPHIARLSYYFVIAGISLSQAVFKTDHAIQKRLDVQLQGVKAKARVQGAEPLRGGQSEAP